MAKLYKVKIFPKTKDFDKELIDFLFEKSPTLKREISINNILNSKVSPIDLSKIFETNSEIDLEEVYGSTFQSHWRSNKDIYAISHIIRKISKVNDELFAIIEETDYSLIIDFENVILRPVYYKHHEDIDEYKIATFDIDFNITQGNTT